MILQVMAVLDVKARAFSQPFCIGNIPLAIRAFTEAANKKDNAIGKHPEDHTLYHLGSFNDETANFELLPQPVSLGMALNYVKDTAHVRQLV